MEGSQFCGLVFVDDQWSLAIVGWDPSLIHPNLPVMPGLDYASYDRTLTLDNKCSRLMFGRTQLLNLHEKVYFWSLAGYDKVSHAVSGCFAIAWHSVLEDCVSALGLVGDGCSHGGRSEGEPTV